MKRIAITQRLIENSSYPEEREALDTRWGTLFERLNFLPIPLPLNFDPLTIIKELNINGIILSGGNDLNSASANALSFKRDAFEKNLVDLAVGNKIPILGVCRGMQLITEHFGGTLQKLSGHSATRHGLVAEASTKQNEFLKQVSEVNSYHNYGVTRLPGNFTGIASAPDDSIEAMTHNSERVMGIMWHPEREEPFNEFHLKLISDFFQ